MVAMASADAKVQSSVQFTELRLHLQLPEQP